MSTPTRRKKPRCGQCGSRRWHRDGSSGLVVCKEGHVLQGYREEEAQDDGDFIATTTRKRNLRKGGRGRKEKKSGEGVYYGARARFLAFQCLQLILRHQLEALRREWPELPPELEAIARDLWSLYVSTQSLTPAPLDEAITFAHDSAAAQFSRARSRSRSYRRSSPSPASRGPSSDSESDIESQLRDMAASGADTDYESSGAVGDGYSTGGGYSTGAESGPSTSTARANRARANKSGILTLVAVLYLSLVSLRIPVLWGDIKTLIEAGRLPYLNAVHILPAALVSALPKRELSRGLDTTHVPSIHAMHLKTIDLGTTLKERFGLSFPELNGAPVLWRCVDRMLLPPTIYTSAKSLLTFLEIPMHVFSPASVAESSSARGNKKELRRGVQGVSRTPRCVMLMAGVLIMVKLRYGLDGEERVETANEGAKVSGAPPLRNWLKALARVQEEEQQDPARVHDLDMDVLDMDDEMIDKYLDYAESTLVLPNHPILYSWRKPDGVEDILSFLPPEERTLPEAGHSTASASTRSPLPSLLARSAAHASSAVTSLYQTAPPSSDPTAESHISAPAPTPLPLAPGEAHALYHDDPSGAFDESLEHVLSYAARIVRTEVDELSSVVDAMERALVISLDKRRKEKARRAGRAGSVGSHEARRRSSE